MTEFIIATNNEKKLIELDRILNPLGIRAVTAKSKGISLDDVEENGTTFRENARIKAQAAFERCGCPVIADDSGLCVDALDGRPGVYSARYGGKELGYQGKIDMLLSEMEGKVDRSAHFSCAICCILGPDKMIEVEGRCDGTIAYAPSGDGGFGYDPVFLVDGVSFASIPSERKDALSHRGNALRMLRDELMKEDYHVDQ